MAEELYNTWLFSDVELNICARMLGYSEWYQVQIGEDREPLEKRMLEGFLRLLEKKLLHIEGDYFLPTEEMRSLMLPVMEPDEIIREKDSKEGAVFFRKKGKKLIGLEKLQTENGCFRLYVVPEKEEIYIDRQRDGEKEDDID